jgi:hypothetical protein
MIRLRSFPRLIATVSLLAVVGCPHRSPLWSPDGKRILVLAGPQGEEVDKAASQLWLVDVAAGKAQRLEPPAAGLRYLAAAWLDAERFVTFTAEWVDDAAKEGSGRIWTRSVSAGARWTAFDAPAPSAERSTRRLPLVLRHGSELMLAYAEGNEATVVVSLASRKELFRLTAAEIVGPGPKGGFLVQRADEPSGGSELVAYDAEFRTLWTSKFSAIRKDVAARLGRKPVEVIFDDTATSQLPAETSQLPAGVAGASWVGVNLIHADPGWRDGIAGFYVQLAASDGAVVGAAGGICLSGQPACAGKAAYAVTAPDPKAKEPPALRAVDPASGKETRSLPLDGVGKDGVHGYAVDPEAKRIALSLSGPVPKLRIYVLEDFDQEREVVLEAK